MKKKHLIIISYIIFIMFAIISNYTIVNADVSSTIWGEAGRLSGAGSMIVGFVQWVGIAVLVGAVIVKGIKFVSASPDGQAAIKKEIIMIVIGAGILLLVTEILQFIIKMVSEAGLD